MTTQEMPVLRAYTVFSWTAPARAGSSPALPIQFGVGVYSNGSVNLSAPPYPGLVTGLAWAELTREIDDAAARWSTAHPLDSVAKTDLLHAAASSLRRQMGLPAEPASPDAPVHLT
jgi:hypothetical protein